MPSEVSFEEAPCRKCVGLVAPEPGEEPRAHQVAIRAPAESNSGSGRPWGIALRLLAPLALVTVTWLAAGGQASTQAAAGGQASMQAAVGGQVSMQAAVGGQVSMQAAAGGQQAPPHAHNVTGYIFMQQAPTTIVEGTKAEYRICRSSKSNSLRACLRVCGLGGAVRAARLIGYQDQGVGG